MEKMVEVLVFQHNELRTLLRQIEQQAVQLSDYSELMTLHGTFLKKLEGHLSLENDFFYPKILEGMKQKHVSEDQIEKTQAFIGKMKDIEVQVLGFFDAYGTAESVASKKEEYLRDLKTMISAILVRIETEEEGIYIMWDFFKTGV